MEQIFRWGFALILVSALVISGTFRKRARDRSGTIARKAEGGPMALFRLAFALPIFLSFVAYIVNPEWMNWSALALPEGVRIAALAVGALCVELLTWVLTSIGSNISETVLTKADHQLITHGPYRWIRHPLYSFSLLAFLALSVIAANWFMALFTLIAGVLIAVVVIPKEEAGLTAKFGTRYTEYMGRTGALTPKVG